MEPKVGMTGYYVPRGTKHQIKLQIIDLDRRRKRFVARYGGSMGQTFVFTSRPDGDYKMLGTTITFIPAEHQPVTFRPVRVDLCRDCGRIVPVSPSPTPDDFGGSCIECWATRDGNREVTRDDVDALIAWNRQVEALAQTPFESADILRACEAVETWGEE